MEKIPEKQTGLTDMVILVYPPPNFLLRGVQ